MTTFKNNAKYGELVFTYLELAEKSTTPVTYPVVLRTMLWNFKGGSLEKASEGTRYQPKTSEHYYPHGSSLRLSQEWPHGRDCASLRSVVQNRLAAGRLKNRSVLARYGTFLGLTASYGNRLGKLQVRSGLAAVYRMFGQIWEWSVTQPVSQSYLDLEAYTAELMSAQCLPSKIDLRSAEECRRRYWETLSQSRFRGLMSAVVQVKDLIRMAGSRQCQANARGMGLRDRERWESMYPQQEVVNSGVGDLGEAARYVSLPVGPLRLKVFQECALLGTGEVRYALGKSDMERLHQMLMAAASALVGVCSQASAGTVAQRLRASEAVRVAERNISRIVESSKLVPPGDEVLVCKGYKRAYTAYLGVLAGPLCREETEVLIREAKETAADGVIDVDGMLGDARGLSASAGLNASKMFKICPAPDVSPATAMMDRIKQIGDGNVVDPEMMPMFRGELTAQILRAYIRSTRTKLELRTGVDLPNWYPAYMASRYDEVPSSEIDRHLVWEGAATMPDTSPYDPKNWKDSGLGADTVRQSEEPWGLGRKSNMITRLLFDDDCPMPGKTYLADEHVIKMFVKAEGHKDPARAIFSANLTDRQAQSWMERAVEKVALHHPSFMIGQPVDVRDAKIAELNRPPVRAGWMALFYSFDISGWSAKMPGEPQRISHEIWANLYGGHLFTMARYINEDAHIYMGLDGYLGWYKNTHSNLEGFNGKEMTMILVALLSLSVKRWRVRVVEEGAMHPETAAQTSALLFAYIDDGLSRIDLPRAGAAEAFRIYKETVIDTFSRCGFSVEVSKCYPSDRFAIFLNEVYVGGRHVVHGVRAAMGICAEPTERHTSLVERVTSVATGVRGAVMAGLNPLSASFLMAYHVMLHLQEWVPEKDPVVLATWSVMPRAWGGLGLPNVMQTFVSGSGSAFEEGTATMQAYARANDFARKVFLRLVKMELEPRTATSVLTAPMSGRVYGGYMVDSRVAETVRKALSELMDSGKVSRYAERLLRYAGTSGFNEYATCVVAVGQLEVIQEQMLDNLAESHPHTIFASFARRMEKSMTLKTIIGVQALRRVMDRNREEATASVQFVRERGSY